MGMAPGTMAAIGRGRKLLYSAIPSLVGILGVSGAYQFLERLVPIRDEEFINSFHRESLRLIFPARGEAWLEEVVRRLSVHNRWSYLDSLILPSLPGALLDRVFAVEGMEAIQRALDRGRGAIVYGIHYGRIWTAIIYVCRKGYPLSTIVNLKGLGAARNVERCMTGALYDTDGFSKDPIYQRLRNNEIILTMADGGVARRPVETRFLGRPVYLSPSFLNWAQETGAALISWIGLSHARDRIELRFSDMSGFPRQDSFGDWMEWLLAPLAEYVRSDPSQWYSARRMLRASQASPCGFEGAYGR